MDRRILNAVRTVGANMKQLREAKGFKTQGAFAEAIGLPQSRVSDWENDRFVPEMPNLLKIAKALGVSLNDLILGVDPDYDKLLSSSDLVGHSEKVQGSAQEADDVSAAYRALQDRYTRFREDVQRAQAALFASLTTHPPEAAHVSATRRKQGRRSRA